MNNGPLLIYLTARDESRGESAVKAIHSDSQLKTASALRADGGLTDVEYHPLDISSGPSIGSFASFLKEKHPEGIDILVNNAGIAMDGFNANVVEKTLDCNYFGTLALTENMLPHMREGGRVVNVSSMTGKLNKYSPDVTKAFKEAREVGDITTLMNDFQAAVAEGKQAEKGWPSAAYSTSKTGVTGMSMILGRQIAEGKGVVTQARGLGHNVGNPIKPGVLLNCCCPGYVNTDMTKGNGRKSPDEGARTPVILALEDIGGRAGEFWEHGEVSSW